MIGCEGIEGDESSPTHNQGRDCLSCHSNFTSAATIFTKLNAQGSTTAHTASGYKLQLLLENNQTITYSSSNGIGNVVYRGDRGAINNFTAQVIDSQGKVVNQSATNSHTVGRLACNSCHTSSGNSNAPGRIVSYDYAKSLMSSQNTSTNTDTNTSTTSTTTSTTSTTTTANKKSFSNDVMPILNTNCKGCHATMGGKYRVTDAAGTYSNIINNSFIDTTTPANSRLLQKATKTINHGGNQLFNTSSTEYQTISAWITEGATNN